jgi:hypothetical protein
VTSFSAINNLSAGLSAFLLDTIAIRFSSVSLGETLKGRSAETHAYGAVFVVVFCDGSGSLEVMAGA